MVVVVLYLGLLNSSLPAGPDLMGEKPLCSFSVIQIHAILSVNNSAAAQYSYQFSSRCQSHLPRGPEFGSSPGPVSWRLTLIPTARRGTYSSCFWTVPDNSDRDSSPLFPPGVVSVASTGLEVHLPTPCSLVSEEREHLPPWGHCFCACLSGLCLLGSCVIHMIFLFPSPYLHINLNFLFKFLVHPLASF